MTNVIYIYMYGIHWCIMNESGHSLYDIIEIYIYLCVTIMLVFDMPHAANKKTIQYISLHKCSTSIVNIYQIYEYTPPPPEIVNSNYGLLNEYSILGRVLWSECDHRACEVINPTKERGPKTLCEFNNRIIIYLYKIINFIK